MSHEPRHRKPKAYLNVLFFDEQFMIDRTASKYLQVGTGTMNPNNPGQIGFMAGSALVANKSGYCYIYISNESDELVYFDNLTLTHDRSSLLEETHYYPFGLTMAGISSKAAGKLENKRKWNKGSEIQNNEFSDGSGLELYATQFRSLDPQLGRFWQIDPKPTDFESPYAAMGNNPILKNDPLGDTVTIRHRTGFLGIFGKFKDYTYDNGKLTDNNGTEVKRGDTKRFVQKAAGALDALRTGGTTGNKLVTDLQNNKQNTYIMKGSNGFKETGDKSGLSNVARWSPSITSSGQDINGSSYRPAFIGLGHELAHGWDKAFDGSINYSEWYRQGTTDEFRIVRKAEIYATHIENQIRAENNIALRAYYGKSIDFEAGTTTPGGLIITPGTRQNANTIRENGLNLVNPTY